MRIGCLQFAPQVGDIDNNLNRADSVLAKANQEDLDNLDLLVLPELAFTGYNFKSLQHISPYLEPSGSGISSLWARTTALKYNTNVVVGYPERVDVSPNWPTGPEYYNSAIIVNGDGETIANYRKSFLFVVDETWALEGKHGFYHGYIPGLGHTTMGICMDINPYKFEAPWHAFEFAFHILEMESNLVIVTMSWLTREDSRLFTRMPAEPDLETLTYWVQRLEPLIRAESDEEVIVVFCNRTGMEDDVVYAGTSAVIGIKEGEVNVYGLLGRGVKELLVVDTDNGPYAKLLHRPDGETTEVNGSTTADVQPGSPSGDKAAQLPPDKNKPDDAGPSPQSPSNHTSASPKESTGRQRREKPPSPKITIPTEGYRRQRSTQRSATIEESPVIETPTAPSPTPLSLRPKLFIPGSRPTNEHVDTPYPGIEPKDEQIRVYGGQVSISNEHNAPNSASDDIEPSSAKYFWVPSQTLLQTPLEPNWPRFGPESPTVASSLVRMPANSRRTPSTGGKRSSSPKSVRSSNSAKSRKSSKSHASSNKSQSNASKKKEESTDNAPPRPSSPKSRNASRSGRHTDRAGSDPDLADIAAIAERLEALNRRPGSAMDSPNPGQEPHDRPRSPKSRNASRSGRPIDFPYPGVEERMTNLSRSSIPIGASPSILPGANERPPSSNVDRPGAPVHQMSSEMARQVPQNGQYGHIRSNLGPSTASPRGADGNSPGRPGDVPTAHIEPDETRTVIWDEINKLVGEVMNRSSSRSASRGRQPGNQRSQSDSPGSQVARSESRGYSHNEAAAQNVPRDDSVVPIRTVTLGNGPSQGSMETIDPDEIVAEVIFHPRGYSVHNNGTPSNSSTTGTPNQGANGVPPQRRNSARAQNGPRVGQRNMSPPPRTSSIPGRRKGDEELSSSRGNSAEISVFKAPTPLGPDATTETLESLPAMSGSSIHTITTPNDSPATPPPRLFEPTTPKAMKLDPDFGSDILSAFSEPTASGTFPPLHRLGNDIAALGPDRPKSAVW